ncbi:hypothetical protein PF007_g25621 [Phytophthora fragariae]|uniref:Uncharacterized protein n=1 Tax=Phytophthora fragariae TaxID=53985 RepID=A0A6A4BXL4_9STRA|nr:hypothetical protein PF007_g25621 [Phytophthora fragariae]KAE9280374.1 hypothetical protein PF001_g24263 [Phytophthora fragariae]
MLSLSNSSRTSPCASPPRPCRAVCAQRTKSPRTPACSASLACSVPPASGMARPATVGAPPSASVCLASRVSVWATVVSVSAPTCWASVRSSVWTMAASAMARPVTACRRPASTTRPPTTASPLLP